MAEPKILVFDIETAPITAYTWGLFDQTIGLNQIKSDWFILAWAAKWYGDPPSKMIYMDSHKSKNIQDDRQLLVGMSYLLNHADIVITQNGDAFDIKKLNARAAINRLPPIKPCKSTDILKESRKVFKFTSHKLEYMTNVLNTKYKKLKHDEYPGFELWSEILNGNQHAWSVMKKYCINDVLATEEAYTNIRGWIKTQNLACYMDDMITRCPCGSDDLMKRGYAHTEAGKFQIYQCQKCGKWPRSPVNLLSKDHKKKLLRGWR